MKTNILSYEIDNMLSKLIFRININKIGTKIDLE